jgi:nucleotide-binding universal stress UspA family protein
VATGRPTSRDRPVAHARSRARWYRDRRDDAAGSVPVAKPSPQDRRLTAIVADSSAPQFRRAVVALSGGRTDRRIVSLAADLARAGHAELVGVHVVEIDWTLPLDADVAGHDEGAQRVLDIAEATAESARYKMETVLLQARDVGAAIVDEATEREADLIICGLPFRRRFGGEFTVGRTIPYILKNAPCGVWVIREAMTEEQA